MYRTIQGEQDVASPLQSNLSRRDRCLQVEIKTDATNQCSSH